jgi:protein gp37
MAETSIQWTATPRADGTFAPGYTFNGWIGCAKVSQGCSHCYAEVDTFARVSKSRGLPLWGENAHRHVTSDENWRKPIRWNREAAAMGERRKVFCASLSDVFEARDDLNTHRERLWNLIEATPHLDWLLLTKRPEEIMQRIPERWSAGLPASIWVGTTVESQEMAEKRIPHLLRVPARVRFLSCEPLIERVDLTDIKERPDGLGYHIDALECDVDTDDDEFEGRSIDWVIIGGESGPRARQFDVAWARDLLEQCRKAGAPAFVKQLGAQVWDSAGAAVVLGKSVLGAEHRVWLVDRAGGDPSEWPEDLRAREFPEVTP